MADDSHIPVFRIGGDPLAWFKQAARIGKTPDGNDPWVFLSDTLKAHANVNPLSGGDQDVEFMGSLATGAVTAIVGTAAAFWVAAAVGGPITLAIAGVFAGVGGMQPRTCRIIVINDTDVPLVPDTGLTDPLHSSYPGCPDVAWIDCGEVVARPGVPKETGGWTEVGTVPARRVLPGGKASMAGVGCYLFRKHYVAGLSFEGTGGVLPFQAKPTSDNAPAVGYLVPQTGDNSAAVTFDLAGAGGAQSFYGDKVDGKRQATFAATGAFGPHASLQAHAALSVANGSEATLTVCFEPA